MASHSFLEHECYIFKHVMLGLEFFLYWQLSSCLLSESLHYVCHCFSLTQNNANQWPLILQIVTTKYYFNFLCDENFGLRVGCFSRQCYVVWPFFGPVCQILLTIQELLTWYCIPLRSRNFSHSLVGCTQTWFQRCGSASGVTCGSAEWHTYTYYLQTMFRYVGNLFVMN